MHTENYNFCCSSCFKKIAKSKPAAARMWLDACLFAEKNGSLFACEELKNLKVLESLGYIVSTECYNLVLVRLKGVKTSCDGERIYCICDGENV